MTLFSEMLALVGYKDSTLASKICKGFDLLCPLPSSRVLPYFDDYVLSGKAGECRRLDFIQAGFFQLMGWETSSEKDSGFSFTASGVEICLEEAHLGLLSVQNFHFFHFPRCKVRMVFASETWDR